MQATRYRPQRNWGARIMEMTYRGMPAVFLENERLRVGVLAGKGTDIFEINYKPRDVDFVWLTPGGVRNPTDYLSTSPDPYATFTDYYLGGWQEVLPNGGVPSAAYGAQFGQHGELAHLPWGYRISDDRPERVAVTFSVRGQKSPFFIEKEISLASGASTSTFEIRERVVNEGKVPASAMWGHHITFGQPFAGPGARIHLPNAATVVPHDPEGRPSERRVRPDRIWTWPMAEDADGQPFDLSIFPPVGTTGEMLDMRDLSEGWYEVENAAGDLRLRVEWDIAVMPYLWYWQEFGGTTDYPFFGRGYVVGLEPFTSYPTHGLARAIDEGNVMTLGPGEAREFWLRAGTT